MNTPPHVSAALVQLQRSVTLSAWVFMACAAVHLLVFGFVHFTEVRWESTEPKQMVQPPSVVQGGGTVRGRPAVTVEAVRGPERVLSRYDAVLHEFCDVSLMGGIIATVGLVVFTFGAMVVAGGSAIPGVQHVVRATTWAVVLAGLCVPWADVFDSLPFGGALMGYEDLVAASGAVDAGEMSGVSLVASAFVAPLVSVGIAVTVLVYARLGVSAGVVATSVNEFDEAIEREIREIQRRGVAAGGRTVGALQRAVGDGVAGGLPRPVEPPLRKPAGEGEGPLSGGKRPI